MAIVISMMSIMCWELVCFLTVNVVGVTVLSSSASRGEMVGKP